MPTTPLNPPDSPPAGPVITEGLATKGMKLIVPLLAIVAGISAVLEGDHSDVTITALAGAIATFISIAFGRQLQSAAALRDAPSPRQLEDGLTPEPEELLEPEVVYLDDGHQERDIHDAGV